MEFTEFARKPFVVQALLVTKENIAEIAEDCGVIQFLDDGTPFILVNQVIVPRMPRVYPGYWMTKMNGAIRFYVPKVFNDLFVQNTPEVQQWIDFLNRPREEATNG